MAKVYPLKLIRPDDLIMADALIKNHTASLVLDTGATNTIIDLNTLLIAGYAFKSMGRKKFETANGIIEADIVKLDQITIWENIVPGFSMSVLSFWKYNKLSLR